MPCGSVRISATRSEIFWPSSMPPPPGLAPWPTTTSMAVRLAQIIRVHAVTRRQILIDERLRLPRSSGVMPPSPVVVEVPAIAAPRPSASLACADSEPKLMPAIVIGIFSSIGFLANRVPSMTFVAALLAIAFERIAANRRAEKQQVVEMRNLALRAAAANVVDAGRGGAPDFR